MKKVTKRKKFREIITAESRNAEWYLFGFVTPSAVRPHVAEIQGNQSREYLTELSRGSKQAMEFEEDPSTASYKYESNIDVSIDSCSSSIIELLF